MSWIPRMPYNRYLAAVLKFVTDVTDPYLNLFRRILPPVRIGPGALDLSPIVATFVLIIVGAIVVGLDPAGERRAAAGRGDRHRRAGRGASTRPPSSWPISNIERGEQVNVFFGLDLTNTRNTGVAFGAFEGGGRWWWRS